MSGSVEGRIRHERHSFLRRGSLALTHPHSSVELMCLHIDALYTHDAAGNLSRVRDHDGARAPRMFVGRTTSGAVVRFRDDVASDTRDELLAIVQEFSNTSDFDLSRSPDAGEAEALRKILARRSPVTSIWVGPAYVFPQSVSDGGVGSCEVVRITDSNAFLLATHFSSWIPDVVHSAPLFAAIVGDAAVSVCASVRATVDAHEAGVETSPAYRGQGHALAVARSWANAVRALNVAPLYSTSWENAASQRVASKLGLVSFGSDLHLT